MINLVTMSNFRCARSVRDTIGEGLITGEKLCVETGANRGPCMGDSGSPLILQGRVVAVVSWGADCGTYPGVFIRVSPHLEWIKRQL